MATALRAIMEVAVHYGKHGMVFATTAEAQKFIEALTDWMLNADYYKEVRELSIVDNKVWYRGADDDIPKWIRIARQHRPGTPEPVEIVYDRPEPSAPSSKGTKASSQEQADVLRKAITKRPDAALSAALTAVQKDAAWVAKADEATLKKVRHALYQRGLKKEADLFRV